MTRRSLLSSLGMFGPPKLVVWLFAIYLFACPLAIAQQWPVKLALWLPAMIVAVGLIRLWGMGKRPSQQGRSGLVHRLVMLFTNIVEGVRRPERPPGLEEGSIDAAVETAE